MRYFSFISCNISTSRNKMYFILVSCQGNIANFCLSFLCSSFSSKMYILLHFRFISINKNRFLIVLDNNNYNKIAGVNDDRILLFGWTMPLRTADDLRTKDGQWKTNQRFTLMYCKRNTQRSTPVQTVRDRGWKSPWWVAVTVILIVWDDRMNEWMTARWQDE